MKKNWKRVTIGEVCDIRGGGTPSKSVPRYWKGSIPWVSPKDMKSEIIEDSIDHVCPEALENSAGSLIPGGSVLVVVRSGILARTVPIAIAGCDLSINQDIKALCPSASLLSRYLWYVLAGNERHLLGLVSRGATVHRLATDHIRSLSFELPTLSDQRRIIAILDEAFAGIATATANAETNHKNARALFESHLQSVFTERGVEWAEQPLGETCEVINGGTPKTGIPQYWDGQHRWVTPAEMGKRLSPYISETQRTISDLGLRNSSAQLLPPHSVILSSRAPIGHLVINTEPMATNQGCKGLVPRGQLQHKFLYYYLSSIRGVLNALGTGATFKELSGGKLKAVRVAVAPLREQHGIVAKLDALSEETQHLATLYERKLAALAALKRSLLHQAFSGNL